MYCENCGVPVDDDANFCLNCGAQLYNDIDVYQNNDVNVYQNNNQVFNMYDNQRVEKADNVQTNYDYQNDNTPVFIIKPVYNFFENTKFNVFLIVSILGLIVSSGNIMNIFKMGSYELLFAFIPSVLIILLGLTVIICTILSRKNTTYEFYLTHLVVENRFLSRLRTELNYCDIQEIYVKQTVMQKMFNIGDINISTNAGYIRSGSNIKSIKNPMSVYEDIRRLTDR